jgi:hypothetical protein
MSQTLSVGYHSLDTSRLQNTRFSQVVQPGVYSGYYVKPNIGSANLLDLGVGDDGISVLVTPEGIRIEETAEVLAAVALAPADSALTRIDLIVCEYAYTVDNTVSATYKVVKGRNQVVSTVDPTPPVVENIYQVVLAQVTVRPQTASSGLPTANIALTDVRTAPKARWASSPEGLAGLKPEVSSADRSLLYVYPGVFPSVDGRRAVHFRGAYSAAIDATNLAEGSEAYYLFGLTDESLVAVVGSADSLDAIPDLSIDVVPIAIVLGRVTNGQVNLTTVTDIRFLYSRRLSDSIEQDSYLDLLGSSVFKYVKVERFVDESGIDVESATLESGDSASLTVEVDSTDTSLKLTWDTAAGTTPGESTTIVTKDILNGSSITAVTHFMVSADATNTNITYQYSTSSATSGFTSTRHLLNQITRVPTSGARKLFLKLFVPPDAYVAGVAKIYSFGVLINLQSSVMNSVSVTELGIGEISKSVTNLISNGNFSSWSQDDTSGNKPNLSTQEDLNFSLNAAADRILLADGWQITSFPVPAVGETVSRVTRNPSDGSETALRYRGAADSGNPGAATVAEYRVPRAAEFVGSQITFATKYETSSAAAYGIGVAQYTRTSAGLVLKTKDEVFATNTDGDLYVHTTTSIGDDVDQIGFYLIFLEIGADTEHVIWQARAAAGTFSDLPYTYTPAAPAVLRQYYERGRVYSAGGASEGDQVGTSAQFGTRKALELGTLVTQTAEAIDSNRSSNIGALNYTGDEHGLVILADASSSALVTIDVDWEAFVKYEGSIQ